jgi:hypothetical protein
MDMSMYATKLFWMLLLLAAIACGKKTETSTSEMGSDEWAQMDSFHMIMAEAYHPYKDSSNVEPVKRMAEEMALAAEDWQKQPLPEKVNNDEVKSLLSQLASGARALSDSIKAGASNEEIGAALTSLHDNFHSINEAWGGSMEKHGH